MARMPPAATWWQSCLEKRACPLEEMQDTPRSPASLLLWSSCQANLSKLPTERKEPSVEVALLATVWGERENLGHDPQLAEDIYLRDIPLLP
jgi:hypothetical protein